MTAPIHPIRKMQKELYGVRNVPPRVQRVISRHVKPLLDALEQEHRDWPDPHFGPKGQSCEVCRLLAAWRAKP